MKVSLSWIKEYLDFELPAIDELVAKVGAQLGAVEEVVDLGKRYQGIVIVKVVECQPIEGSDHLSVCRIDDGGAVKDVERDKDGLVQVVCGAPNVTAGVTVAWLPPGSTVPATVDDDEPFVLEARELRGAKSNGMLASPKELALGDSHEGLLLLDDGKPGDDFAKTFKLNDYIIDIENKMFTHRPDCFGMLGVAREIAGILGKPFKSPDWYKPNQTISVSGEKKLKVEVRNEIPELVPRFAAIAVADVKNGTSPIWLQAALCAVGSRPISTIVDLTNYFMLLTGQPLHAYDYDKVVAQDTGVDHAVLTVRLPHPGEKLQLINGKEIEPRAEAILVANSTQAIGLGGVMGGATTEVDDTTKNIILESANFDMYSTRRTSMAHGIFSDAVSRFNKGQSPLQNVAVLARADELALQLCGGQISDSVDDNHLPSETTTRQSLHPPITTDDSFINHRLGLSLTAEDMKKLLENVEFKVAVNGDTLVVTAPFWRTDIERREDVVEEVGRLYGYDKLPLQLPKRDLTPAPKDPLLETKAEIRARLSKAGANEVLTYSFIHGELMDKTGQDKTKAFQLGNALSPDLQYYRISLMPSLLDKVHANIKTGYDEFALFELGKTHSLDNQTDDEGLPREFEFTALVVTAADKLKKAGAAYYQARKYLENLLEPGSLEFKPVTKDMEQYPVVQPYNLQRTALVSVKGGAFLGIIGEFKPSVTRALKLPTYCAGFEIDTTVLQPVLAAGSSYTPLSRFPSVKQDITLKLPAELSYQTIDEFVAAELSRAAPQDSRVQLEPVGIYQSQEDQAHKNLTLRLTITSYERTMTDVEVNKLLDHVAEAAKAKFNAERI